MKKTIIFTAFFFLIFNTLNAQRIKLDTVYLNKNKIVSEIKEFATYYRVYVLLPNELSRYQYRDFYLSGELAGDGFFIMDNGYNSIRYDGENSTYFKNGKTKSCYHYLNGISEGHQIDYNEDGLILKDWNTRLGELDGMVTVFGENGSYTKTEYSNGNPVVPFYYSVSSDGIVTTLDYQTDKVYWRSLSQSEQKIQYRNGIPWQYYTQNGLMLALTDDTFQSYGKWHKIDVIICNQSLVPIEFDPKDISAELLTQKGEFSHLIVWSDKDYMKKVKKAQNWQSLGAALAEASAAASAGYSTSRTTTNTSISGYSSRNGSAVALGNNSQMAVGYSSSTGIMNGNVSSTSTTTTYNHAAAYQAQVLAQQRMSDLSTSQWLERQAIDRGYLKRATIFPGETIAGYFLVEWKDGRAVVFRIPVCGVQYIFAWNYQ